MLAGLRQRLQRWMRPRGPEVLPVQLDRHRIYILPTASGLFFGLLLGTMLLGALNFNNNPALLLALLLAGTALANDKVNINTADAATIDAVLLNVGPAKAQAIVDYRKANGVFKSAEELAMVKGIGLKTVEKNRDRIEVGRAAAPAKQAAGAAAAKAKPVARR